MTRLSAEADIALNLLSGYGRGSVNGQSLSKLYASDYADPPSCRRVLEELAANGFVQLITPDPHRAWSRSGPHYQIAYGRVYAWLEAGGAIKLAALAPQGPRSRLCALAG